MRVAEILLKWDNIRSTRSSARRSRRKAFIGNADMNKLGDAVDMR